jgi:hypothetical protein
MAGNSAFVSLPAAQSPQIRVDAHKLVRYLREVLTPFGHPQRSYVRYKKENINESISVLVCVRHAGNRRESERLQPQE